MKTVLHRIHGNIFYLLPLAFLLGLFLPGVDTAGAFPLKIIISLIIFLGCFRVKLEDLSRKNLFLALKFWVTRFIIFPVLLFVIADYFQLALAPAILILSLAPAGVSSIALASIFGGNIALCFMLVIISSLSAPLVYSSYSALLLTSKIDLNIIQMLIELSLIIFTPIIIFIILPKIKYLQSYVSRTGPAWSAYLISLLLLFAVAMQRDAFHLSFMLIKELAILILLFFLYYLIGFVFPKSKMEDRLSFAICSGANNNAFAITVAASFFTAIEVRFNVLSEVLWLIGVLLLPKVIKKVKNSTYN